MRCRLPPRRRVPGDALLKHGTLSLQDLLHFGRHDCASFGHAAGQRKLALVVRPRYRHELQRVVPRVVARDDRVNRMVWPPAKERAAAAQPSAPTRVARPAVIVEGDGALERLPLREGVEGREQSGFASPVQRLATQPIAAWLAKILQILIERPLVQFLAAQLAAASPELHRVRELSAAIILALGGVGIWRSEVHRLVISHLGVPADLVGLERLPLRIPRGLVER